MNYNLDGWLFLCAIFAFLIGFTFVQIMKRRVLKFGDGVYRAPEGVTSMNYQAVGGGGSIRQELKMQEPPVQIIQNVEQLQAFINSRRPMGDMIVSPPDPGSRLDREILNQNKANDMAEFCFDVGAAMYYMKCQEMASCFTLDNMHIDVELKIKVGTEHGA